MGNRIERSETAKGRSLCPKGGAGGRWQKTFDGLKNKPFGRLRAEWLGETKAWASSANAKAMQAHFLCMAHNLMIWCEAELEHRHGVRNDAELARRAKRLEKERRRLAKDKAKLPLLVRAFQRLTVRSVKFIRWLKGCSSSLSFTTSPTSPPCATYAQLYRWNPGHRCCPEWHSYHF